MPLASGDVLVYDGSQWNNQKTVPGPFTIDSPTFHVDSANDRVGIGTTSPEATLHVKTASDWTDESGTRRLSYFVPSASPAASSSASFRAMNGQLLLKGSSNYTGSCFGMLLFVSHQGTGTVTLAYALSATNEVTGGGTVTTAYGGHLGVTIATAASTITSAIAGNFRISNNVSGGGITSAWGIRVQDPAITSGATIGTIYGMRINNQGASGVTTAYGLYVDSQSGASGSNYAAIFAGGSVGIGTTSPTVTLDVVGATGIKVSSTSGGMCRLAYTGGPPQSYNLLCATDGSFRVIDETAGGAPARLFVSPSTGYVCVGTGGANSKLQVTGPIATAVTNVTTSPYTVTADDSVVRVGTDSGAITVNLPTAALITGRKYTIKRVSGGNNVTVTPSGSETIDGAANYVLNALYKYVSIVSDGTDWAIVANN